ncbi:MAG: transaldolase [Propionibacteriales bacterium]|nr:transaldolase [Propionibacteriales bacterium]
MNERLQALSKAGVSVWLDDISRERLRDGHLESLIKDKSVVGVTSNPTIFAKAVSEADDYAEQVHDLAVRRVPLDEAVRLITTYDIRWACDQLRDVYDATVGVDGRVSIEVDPRLAHNTDATIAEAKALWWMVNRPNLMVKIPATEAGLPAITETLAAGISVNVTLIFALDRYDQVVDAFMSGLEKAQANDHDLATIESVASFFVSRVDTEVDKRLDALGTPEAKAMRSKAAIANARLAYERFEAAFATDRWKALGAAGARPQRTLWASTSVKDPNLPDSMYVTELVAENVVNTMPEPTIEATGDHAEITGDTVRPGYADARKVLNDLAGLGVSYDDVVQVLEAEGVQKFADSWEDLLRTVSTALDEAAP